MIPTGTSWPNKGIRSWSVPQWHQLQCSWRRPAGRIASHMKLVTASGHVTAQLVNHRWRPRYTTVVRKTEYVTGGRSRYRGNTETTEPLGPPPQVNKFGQDDDGERRPRPVRRVRAPQRFGPSAAIFVYRPLFPNTRHDPAQPSRPSFSDNPRARTRSLRAHLRWWCNKRTHWRTHCHTHTHIHTHTRRTIRVRVAAGGTESHQLYTTHDDDDDGGGGKYTHGTDTATLKFTTVVGCLARTRFFTAHGGTGVTRFTYTRHTHGPRSSTHTLLNTTTTASTSTAP